MKLVPIHQNFIDKAWQDGAHQLAEACDTSGGEITGDQLKMILSRGERTLLRLDACETFEHDGKELMSNNVKTVGWAVVRVDQLPNMRVLFITDLVCHNGGFERFFQPVREMAASLGCSRVRCAAKPAQERLYRMKCGWQPIYSVLEVSA